MNRPEEVQKKLESVRAWLQRNGLEALLINSQANFAWLTGGGENYVYVGDAAGEAYLLVVPDRTYLLTNNIEARRKVPGHDDTIKLPITESAAIGPCI